MNILDLKKELINLIEAKELALKKNMEIQVNTLGGEIAKETYVGFAKLHIEELKMILSDLEKVEQ